MEDKRRGEEDKAQKEKRETKKKEDGSMEADIQALSAGLEQQMEIRDNVCAIDNELMELTNQMCLKDNPSMPYIQ